MSFRCDICNEPQPTGVAPTTIVTHVRKKVYHANQSVIPGHETIKEVRACAPCKDVIGDTEPTMHLGDLPLAVLPPHSGGALPDFQNNVVP